MSERPVTPDEGRGAGRLIHETGAAAERWLRAMGQQCRRVGAMAALLGESLVWLTRGLVVPGVKLRRAAIAEQMVRVGVDSIPIVMLVAAFMGCILALQLAPTLERYGQLDRVAQVVAIAMVRELGPLLTAIVLSGFAGASIAAEIGAMVESEEIKALRAHALNPVHFLVAAGGDGGDDRGTGGDRGPRGRIGRVPYLMAGTGHRPAGIPGPDPGGAGGQGLPHRALQGRGVRRAYLPDRMPRGADGQRRRGGRGAGNDRDGREVHRGDHRHGRGVHGRVLCLRIVRNATKRRRSAMRNEGRGRA